MKHNKLYISIVLFLIAILPAAAQQKWGQWSKWGDTHDGFYQNPVLPADFSDIDCIGVNGTYYMISSTFQYQPGMIIMKSNDMVNWQVAGYAVKDIRQISGAMNYDQMDRYGRGIWAGAIRHYNGRFYVYFGTPDEGYFMTSAKSVEGPWDDLTKMSISGGWDDPCPFFDEDGHGYLIGTCYQDNYKTYIMSLTSDYKDVIPDTKVLIHEGRGREANKLYKQDGWYYHLFSEVNNEGRVLMIQRSRSIMGPYEGARPMSLTQTNYREPNQGGFLQDASGNWFFLTHHGSGDWSGRIASLLPVSWIDGWPIVGKETKDNSGNIVGEMVWRYQKPQTMTQKSNSHDSRLTSTQHGGRSFWGKKSTVSKSVPYGYAWEWNYYPRTNKEKISYRGGRMLVTLEAFKPLEEDNLLKAGNTLTTRCWRTLLSRVTVKMNISKMADGQKSGICHLSGSWSEFGVVQKGKTRTLFVQTKDSELKKISVLSGRKSKVIYLRSEWGLDGKSIYSYSHDGIHYTKLNSDPYQLQWSYYRGDRLGLFTYNNLSESGQVRIEVLENKK